MNLKLILNSKLVVYPSLTLLFCLILRTGVEALTMDDISPTNLINKVAQGVNPSPLPVPERPPVGRYDESQSIEPCAVPPPRQIAQAAQYRYQLRATDTTPAPVARRQGTRTYWAGSDRVLKDPRAITLLNLAPGTKRSTIADRVGMGTFDGDSYVWETGDGLIRANFKAANRLNDDQLEWMGLQ
jgi:hypothetical protein